MPSHSHHHSRRSRSRSRSRSPTPDDEERRLPYDANPISESDYFHKNDEFRVWLKDEKRKYFDELSGDKARSYFRKFVKAWNRGKLSKKLYAGVDSHDVSANPSTAYKWSFASKSSHQNDEASRSVRAEVGRATGSRPVHGPTMPSAHDRALAEEEAEEYRAAERAYKRKREKKEDKERIEDMVGPKEVGRAGQQDAKRARREADKAFREGREDAGLELDENTLMGGGNDFKAQIARRDAAKKRHEHARDAKAVELRERADARQQKEKATMDMFQQLAKQRFG